MNETIKKAQQTIAEERKTKISEHGNLKRYLSQINGLKMSAERVRGNIMKANRRIKECEVIVKEERKKMREKNRLLKKNKIAAIKSIEEEAEKNKIAAIKSIEEEVEKNKIAAIKSIEEEAEKNKIAAIKSIEEEAAKDAATLEQTENASDTVGMGSSGGEVVAPILSQSERDNAVRVMLTQALLKTEGFEEFMSELDDKPLLKRKKRRTPLNITGNSIKDAQNIWKKNDVEVKDFLNWLPSIVNVTGFFLSQQPFRPFSAPRVAMFHLGMKAKGGVINLRKGLFSKKNGEGPPFIMRGRLIGCGNKCAAVLLDDPDDYEPDVMTSTQFKDMRNAYNKGRGQIKKVVYEESVIVLDDDEGDVEEKINKLAEERGWRIHST